MNCLQNQPTPVKMISIADEAVTELNFLDYYPSPGVSPLKGIEKQFTKTRKSTLMNFITERFY